MDAVDDLIEDSFKLQQMSREELIAECERRAEVAHKIWGAIMTNYGQDGFIKILKAIGGI